MKKLFLFLLPILFTLSINAQDDRTYEAVTYLNDISVSEIPRFVELHKKFSNMAHDENRLVTGDWLFRHWYGSGHTFVIYRQFNSMQDYHRDTDMVNQNIIKIIQAVDNEEERNALMDEWSELRAFYDGHTDEIRAAYPDTGFTTIENVDFDAPFVMSVGRYNSSGSWSELGNAFYNWSIKPEIDQGICIAGGVSYHYMGSGPEVEVWQCYNSLVDFATAVSSTAEMSEESRQAMRTFWSLADGGHEDQIYLHIGHMNLETGSFDLAGKDR